MKRLAERLAWAVVLVWAVISLAFIINNVLPSDPARMVAGPAARPQDVERIRKQLGLDRPLPVQYARFMTRLVHLGPSSAEGDHASCAIWGPLHVDLGKSYQQRRPVVTILAERLPRTLMLAGAALGVQVVLGMLLGIAAALRRGTRLDGMLVGASLLGVSVPPFVMGLGLQYVLARELQWVPLDGYGKTPHEHLVSLVLPALTLGIFGVGFYTRLSRNEVLDALTKDWVRTARAKGAPRYRVVLMHGVRNALMPLLTAAALELGMLLSGTAVAETLFRWPGIGALSVGALLDRDGPIVLGTVLLTSSAIVISSVVVDLLYGVLDPRVRRMDPSAGRAE